MSQQVIFSRHLKESGHFIGLDKQDIYNALFYGEQFIKVQGQRGNWGKGEHSLTFKELPSFKGNRKFCIVSFTENDNVIFVISAMIGSLGHLIKAGFQLK